VNLYYCKCVVFWNWDGFNFDYIFGAGGLVIARLYTGTVQEVILSFL